MSPAVKMSHHGYSPLLLCYCIAMYLAMIIVFSNTVRSIYEPDRMTQCVATAMTDQ